MADDPRHDPNGDLRGRVYALTTKFEMLQESMAQALREIKDELRRQEVSVKETVRETEQRAQSRTQEITRTIEQQNTNIREALREDRQQWINANDRTRQDFIQLVKGLEEKQSHLMKDMDEKYRNQQAQFLPIQRYVFMGLGMLVLLGALVGVIIKLIGKP